MFKYSFASYPFPVFDADYLGKMMALNTAYYCVRKNQRIVAVAAAEIERTARYAEITDFATVPDCRGQGLAASILHHMEQELRHQNIKTAFTIARAKSLAMNRVFHKSGYHYAGLLKNNTQISGNIENMTVWYKAL